MKELDDLIDYCHNKYINGACSHCTNQVGAYCAKCLYTQGSCSECLNHILNENKPSFHYPCQRITYYYCLHFFDRFVSEIRRFFYYSKPKGTDFNFVSLGCGPGSELYGIVEGLRQSLGNNFNLKYRGYDLEPIWNDVQSVTKSLFTGSNCDVDFYNKDMFREWQDAEDRVYPVFGVKDLDEEAIEYMRLMVKSDNPDHEWLKMDDEAFLRSGQMIMVDPETGQEGITLAAILLFGKRNTIASVLPQYSIANVFSQMGIVEELGSGTKKMFRYTPLFSGGKEPQIEEEDVYKIVIPYEGMTDINRYQTDNNQYGTEGAGFAQ